MTNLSGLEDTVLVSSCDSCGNAVCQSRDGWWWHDRHGALDCELADRDSEYVKIVMIQRSRKFTYLYPYTGEHSLDTDDEAEL